MRRDSCGDVMISGLTRSSDFPHTSGTYQTADDVFLLKMELLPAGVSRYGGPTPGCSGPLEIGVTSIPLSGNPSFGVTCAGAPPFGSGILAFSSAAASVAAVRIRPRSLDRSERPRASHPSRDGKRARVLGRAAPSARRSGDHRADRVRAVRLAGSLRARRPVGLVRARDHDPVGGGKQKGPRRSRPLLSRASGGAHGTV